MGEARFKVQSRTVPDVSIGMSYSPTEEFEQMTYKAKQTFITLRTTSLSDPANIIVEGTGIEIWYGDGSIVDIASGAIALMPISTTTILIKAFDISRFRADWAKTESNLKYIEIHSLGSISTFAGLASYSANLTDFVCDVDTSDIISTGAMFSGASSLTNVSQFSTYSCVNMYSTFKGCASLINPPDIDFTSCDNASDFFAGCISMTVPPDLINLSNANNIDRFFMNSGIIDPISMDLTNTYGYAVYLGCANITTVSSTITFGNNVYRSFFQDCVNLVNVTSILDLTLSVGSGQMFKGCTKLEKVDDITCIVSGHTTGTFHELFSGASSLICVGGRLDNTFDYIAATDIFVGCTSLVNPTAVEVGNFDIYPGYNYTYTCI